MAGIRRRGETFEDHEAPDGLPHAGKSAVIVSSATPGAGDGRSPDLLSVPVGLDDDLAHALAVRPARRTLPGLTAFLGAAVLVSGGFLGGVLVQKHEGSGSGSGTAAALAAAFGRNRTGTGSGATGSTGTPRTGSAAGAGAAAGGSTIGTVTLVDGTTVYVTTTDGSIVKVTTSKDTSITVTKSGTAGDLTPGTTVVVQGSAGPDGVVKATRVTQAGGGGGFAGFGARTRTGTGAGTGSGSGGADAPQAGFPPPGNG